MSFEYLHDRATVGIINELQSIAHIRNMKEKAAQEEARREEKNPKRKPTDGRPQHNRVHENRLREQELLKTLDITSFDDINEALGG